MRFPALLVTLSVLGDVNKFFQNLFYNVLWWIIGYGPLGFFTAMIVQTILVPIPSELILMLGGMAFSVQYNVFSLIPLMVLFFLQSSEFSFILFLFLPPEFFSYFALMFYLPLLTSPYNLDYGIILAGLVGGTGEVAGCIIAFYIARFVGRPVIDRWEKEAIDIRKGVYQTSGGRMRRAFDKAIIYNLGDAVLVADRWFTKWGGWAILATRLIPFVPFDLVSYGSGLTKIKFKTFFIPSVIGGYPRAFMYCFFGAKLLQYLTYTTFGNPYTLFFLIVGLVVVLVAIIYEFVIKRKFLVARSNTKK
nr:VTT domain-containing protein [Candidatus Freyarchaeota archaeon]